MLDKFLNQTSFSSTEDFAENYKVNVPDNFNFGYDVVDEWAKKAPQKSALCWVNDKGEHFRITYKELKEKSDQAASFFLQQGIKKGDMVMLILKRRYQFWYAIIGLHKIGATVIPATHLLTKKDIVYRNNAADIKAIIAVDDDLVLSHVDESMDDSPSVEVKICCGKTDRLGWVSFEEGLKSAAPFVRPSHVNENDDMMLLYFTSGTTGEPKMVIHNFVYPLGHIVTAKYWHNLHENSLHLTIADTGWGKAVWGKLYGQMIVGADIMVYDHDKFVPSEILQLMADYKVTSFCAPPTVYRFLIKENFSDYDLSSLEYATTAGEALNPSVFEAFKDATGLMIREAFGQTETTATIITFPWMEAVPGSMGVPNPTYNMDLMSESGRSVEDGEVGQVVFRTDKVVPLGLFMGYYKDEELTRSVYSDNLYKTGDMAWRDQNGYFWFEGRADDVIKSSGYRIGPFEVESAILSHPAVVECAVTGVPDEIRGQVIKATIVLNAKFNNQDKEVLIKDIQNHTKSVTAPYKYPRIVEFVDELPKTISGKIKRADIRKSN
ncbi:MAG TPA: AMP-binding protein [Dysgonamonadaceae bacterium]|nr:AMP-binding protein [Dysgonamonadaceae bacterium]